MEKINEKYNEKISIAVDRIIEDLSCRRGLRQEWDNIDDDIKKEIRDEWIKIISITLNKEK